MAVFSVNQATHLYYMGKINPDDGASFADKDYIYFMSDSDVRSDLIEKKNILSISATTTTKMDITPTNINLTLGDVALKDQKVIPGEYVVRFIINNYYGPSMYDGAIKHAAVFVGANTTQADFMKDLADSINKNLSREIEKPFTATASENKLTITPHATEWKLGTKAVTVPTIEVLGVWKDFDNHGFEQEWLIATKAAGTSIANSGAQKLCDLEYFCLGERGDIYRNVGWPNVVETKGVLDPTAVYDVVTIHYAYVGSNEGAQKSEKTIVLVCDEYEGSNMEDWLSSANVTVPISKEKEEEE